MAGSKGFVGRGRELSVLRSALDEDVRLVLVMGDAGVGKTRFVGEGLRLAASAGVLPARGGCLPLTEKLPLLPVADALDVLSRLEDGQLLQGALDATPPYVRAEAARLLPELGSAEAESGEQAGQWRRERLFSGVAELLAAVARPCGLCLVIEDVHWADGETLDFLTFLARAGRCDAVTMVVTCRSDEVPLDPEVRGWLAHARGGSGVAEVVLGPLSRDEVAEQAAGLAGGPLPVAAVDELYARSEGNPFFTEQLVAAALASPGAGGWQAPAALPPRLAELLAARVSGCGTDARAALAALAVAGRPLTEDQLRDVAGLPAEALRGGLRELVGARLLGDMAADGACRPRHALLAEAVAAGLLPGERLALHECVARMLEGTGDQALAAEAAGHWAAAGRPAEELRARAAAGEAAERVFGYAAAGAHWQRAIELCQARPGAVGEAGLDLPALYVRAMDAWHVSGDTERADRLAEEALRRFAGHPDAVTSAVIYQRAARFRGLENIYLGGQQAAGSGLALIEEALRRFEQAPPSAQYAEALFDYGNHFLMWGEERHRDSLAALSRALEVAETVGATALISRILSILSQHQFMQGQVAEGFAVLARARALAEAADDGEAALLQAVFESDALVRTAQLTQAAQTGRRGLRAAGQAGLAGYMNTAILACNTADALISAGRITEAAALVDPLTGEPPDQDHWLVHQCRAEIDLLRGDLQAATRRQQQIAACVGDLGSVDWHRENGQRAAELALWSRQPAEALNNVRQVTARFTTPYWAIFCGRLLAQGIRACADLAERARARRDEDSAAAAGDAGRELASWVEQMAGAPFVSHPFVATIPAEHATWHAERRRLEGAADPAAWDAAAEAWQALGFPHRAGYAHWRQAEALQNTGQPREAVGEALRPAAAMAQGHAPLQAEISKLARRAHIPRPTPQTTPDAAARRPTEAAASVQRLSARERELLALLAQGRTNAEIAAQLYISLRTVGSHLDRIRDKTGCRRRADLIRLALQAGLV